MVSGKGGSSGVRRGGESCACRSGDFRRYRLNFGESWFMLLPPRKITSKFTHQQLSAFQVSGAKPDSEPLDFFFVHTT
jgi:hypothetical protein